MFDVIGTWMIPFNLILTFFVVVFFIWNPKYLLKAYGKFITWFMGFSRKQVLVNDLSLSYIERGHLSMTMGRPSILFVHGYTSQKENWIDLLKNLPPKMHVIALDLPGHGESEYKGETLCIEFYTKTVKKFVDRVGLNKQKFNLVGQSMGGCIAGMYACHYPNDLLSVSLFCPIGVENKNWGQEVNMFKETGRFNMLPQSMEEMYKALRVLSSNPLPIPDILKRGMFQVRLEKETFYRKLLEALSYEMNVLENSLHKIKIPTLLLWGKQDELVSVDSVKLIDQNLHPNRKKIVVLDNVGHAISMEAPKKALDLVLEFVKPL